MSYRLGPCKLEAKHTIGGDDPRNVYQVGKYTIEVSKLRDEITYYVPYYTSGGTDPRRAFPNMTFDDRELRIPIEDIVEEMALRAPPAELAKALWTENKEVREEFISNFCTYYGDASEADKRAILARLKEAVHSLALENLGEAMRKMEFEPSRKYNFFQEISNANLLLRQLDVRYQRTAENPDGVLLQLRDDFNSDEFRVGGESWNAARDAWRREVLKKFFPPPVAPEEAPKKDEIEF